MGRQGSGLRCIAAAVIALAAMSMGVATVAAAEGLKVHGIFGPNMVIERDKPITIWGWAQPRRKVSAQFGEAKAEATAGGEAGRSQVAFPAQQLTVNRILYLSCLGGFLLLPFAVLLLRAFRRKFMPWWLAFLAVAALGWLLVNGTVHFSFAHLGDLIHSYGDNPPNELVERWANDGAKRVFALFFGWVYALVWFVPLLLVYGLIQLFRRRSPTLMKTLALLLLCSMGACSPKRPAESSREISGTQAERIAAVSKLVSKLAPMPSPLLDAHFVEQQTGDGRLGPSDFAAFYALTVAPADLAAWRSALRPIEAQNTPPKYVAPKQPLPWWLTHDGFLGLTFYSPESLTGRSNGWVGIAPDGKIFVYAFTM